MTQQLQLETVSTYTSFALLLPHLTFIYGNGRCHAGRHGCRAAGSDPQGRGGRPYSGRTSNPEQYLKQGPDINIYTPLPLYVTGTDTETPLWVTK